MQRVWVGLRFSRSLGRYARFACTKLKPEILRQTSIARYLSLSQRAMAQQVISEGTFTSVERGCLNTTDYRIFFNDANGRLISPFHDIPLYPDPAKKDVINMVVEIPRWTNHKMEISTSEELNPIKQDVKKGAIRFVKNVFPHHGYIWNYGALPQTWEDPTFVETETNTKGDNDPLDACEIGQKVHARGSVIQVKPLGVMCLVDEGETDWKILCIDITDPLADKLNDVADIEREMPGFINATHEWFKIYKVPDGKPKNQFGFDGKALDREKAVNVVKQANEQWQKLQTEGSPNICCKNVSVMGSPHLIEASDAKAIVEKAPGVGPAKPLPDGVDKWYYVSDRNEAPKL